MRYFDDSIRWQQQIADQMSGLKMSGVLDLVQNTAFMDNYKSIISATQGIRDTLEPLRHQFDYMKNLNLSLQSVESSLISNINMNAALTENYEKLAGTAHQSRSGGVILWKSNAITAIINMISSCMGKNAPTAILKINPSVLKAPGGLWDMRTTPTAIPVMITAGSNGGKIPCAAAIPFMGSPRCAGSGLI